MQSLEEIQMDLNGDGTVHEFESQNAPPVRGEKLTSKGTQTPGQIEGETIPGVLLK